MMIDHRAAHAEKQTPARTESATGGSHDAGALAVEIRRGLARFTLDVAFRVPRGLTVLFGPSGAGKSLTLQSIAGLFPLDSAKVSVGATVWHDSEAGICLPPQRRHVGYVPQSYALFPHLTVEQNIAFGLKVRGRQAGKRVGELIELMQLGGLERQRPAQLSGGQQQRVALARALAADSQLLLLDEPFSSLDATVRESLCAEMRTFHERVHVPITLVTHDAAEARMLADRVVVIQQGHVLQVGTANEVFRSPQTRAVAALVGMHICWRGEVISVAPVGHAASPELQAIDIHVDGLVLRAEASRAMPIRCGQTIDIGIRTDEVRVYASEASARILGVGETIAPMTLTAGLVISDQAKGAFHRIAVRLVTGPTLEIPMIVRELHDLRIGVGSPVTLGIPASAVHVLGG